MPLTQFQPSRPIKFLALALIASLALFAGLAPAQDIIKSPSDSRIYRSLQLDNGLKVILVSDPATDMAAASLSVNVGSSANPQQWAGLAHFLEHMLFLGTEKYPNPGEYKDFMQRNGGGDNAYTAFDETNYFFRIKAGKLRPAMDRFAQFFISPLFNSEYVDRERQVVNSEYLGRKKSDGRRIFSAARMAMNPAHPSSRFSVGNLTTLGDRAGAEVRTELIDFYRQHYSANLMALTVLGREPIAELEGWVRDIFSAVPNHNAKVPQIQAPMYLPGSLPARLEVRPVKKQQSMNLSFPLPPVREYWRAKPVQYITQLLGHEGQGSLLATLKARGWAQGLSAGLGFEHPSGAALNIHIQLTPAGLKHQQEILSLVFADIRLLRKHGIARWIFNETQRLAEIDFRFQETAAPLSLVRRLSSLQHQFPAAEVLHGPYAYQEYRPELIATFLDKLVPENLLLTVVDKNARTNAKTRWYDAPYQLDHISADKIIGSQQTPQLQAALAIPKPNPFIPDNLDMLATADGPSIPVSVLEQPGLALFQQQDMSFGLPKANFFFNLRLPIANDSPRHSVLTQLYVNLVNDQLNEYAYPAALAGLGFQLYSHMRGISVRVSGYADRQAELLQRILKTLTAPELQAQRFAILKAELKRGLLNRRRNQPYRQALSTLRDLLVKPRWTDTEQLAVIDAITLQELRTFVPRLLSKMDVVALSHGNVGTGEARSMATQVQQALLTTAKVQPVKRGQVLRLKRGDNILKNLSVDHPESATVLYYQVGAKTLRNRALAALASLIVSSPMFDDLRTEKKLGYIVFANPMPILEVPGLAFTVQSPNTPSTQLQTHMQDFFRKYSQRIKSMTEAEFRQHQQSLLARVLEEERRLGERTRRYWNELDRGNTAFDGRDKLAASIRKLTLNELQEFYNRVLLLADKRLIAIHASGNNAPDAATTASTQDINAMRLQQNHDYYPAD